MEHRLSGSIWCTKRTVGVIWSARLLWSRSPDLTVMHPHVWCRCCAIPCVFKWPIAYASRTLTKAEWGYAQLEKEALSLIYRVKKFHPFHYGRRFILVTDHKPLLTTLGQKEGLPRLASARLQRWAIMLTVYQYALEFRPTYVNADGCVVESLLVHSGKLAK